MKKNKNETRFEFIKSAAAINTSEHLPKNSSDVLNAEMIKSTKKSNDP